MIVPYNYVNTNMLLGLPTRLLNQLLYKWDLMSSSRFEMELLSSFVLSSAYHERLGHFTQGTKYLSCSLRGMAEFLNKPESRRWSALFRLLFSQNLFQSKDAEFPNYWAIKCSPTKLSWMMKKKLSLPGCYYCCLLQKHEQINDEVASRYLLRIRFL